MHNLASMPDIAPPESLEQSVPALDISLDPQNGRLSISGQLGIAEASAAEPRLRDLADSHDGALVIDISNASRIDTVGAWLIHRTLRDHPQSRIEGASSQARQLLDEVARADHPLAGPPAQLPFPLHELNRLGSYIISFGQTMVQAVGFVGLTMVASASAVLARRGVRWRSVVVQMEETGINALGIIGVMSFLIGVVLAQQGAVQLRQFGAEMFVINLVGRSTFRELGILLTAIMVAGRSASAFAAQIGSMKLAEEIDAMRTIGLKPVEILVLPRVIALVIMMPLLAFFASVLGVIGGGIFSWLSLDIPPATFAQRLREVVPMTDFWIGLIKAPVFGAIIAIIGCHQGFQVTGNAESVGQRTTLAVVQAIFAVIVLDAVFAVFFTAMGLT